METEHDSYETAPGDSGMDANASLKLGDPIFSTVQYKKEGEWKTGHGPKIVGGLKALSKLVHYPKEAMKEGIEGTVVVEALIERDGSPVYANVLNSEHPLLDKAAQDAVLSATFKAARRNGVITRAFINIPIRFRLQ